jgi:HSP20 family protein
MATTPVPVKPTSSAQATDRPGAVTSFRTELDRLFDRFMGGFPLTPFRFSPLPGAVSPATDVTEDDTTFKLSAELPGMSYNDVQVQISGDILTVKGEKHQHREEKEKNYYLTERSYGSFQRSFMLPPDIDQSKISAEFSNGVLTVTMPKAAQAKPKTIEVKAAT